MLIFRRDEGGSSMKRETERLLRRQTKARLSRRPLVWLEKSFDPRKVWDFFFWVFANKSLSLFCASPPSPSSILSLFWLFLGKSSEEGERGKNNKPLPLSTHRGLEFPPLWHTDSFTWCETRHRMWTSTALPQHNHRSPSFVPLCLSFTCGHKQPRLRRFVFLF